MDSMVDWCRSNKIPFTEDQEIAEKYILSRGARPFIDYGYANVIQKADILFDLECEKALEVGLIQ
jgi:hypothetical protein